jgi:hypothetical protein
VKTKKLCFIYFFIDNFWQRGTGGGVESPLLPGSGDLGYIKKKLFGNEWFSELKRSLLKLFDVLMS